MNYFKISALAFVASLAACSESPQTTQNSNEPAISNTAPGAPGAPSVWAFSGKTGIGTSYEQYLNGQYSDQAPTQTVSKVWFSLAQGIITETMFGLIHEAQIKDMQFSIIGSDFFDTEQNDTISTIEYLHTDEAGRPLSLAYRVVNKDKEGHYEIEKHIFTDPDQQSMFVRVYFKALTAGITPHLHVNPHMNNNGPGDSATATLSELTASDSGTFMTIKANKEFAKSSAGFVGASDGLTDLAENGQMNWQYATTGEQTGNVSLTAELSPLAVGETVSYDFVVGFGQSKADSQASANTTLATGYDSVLAHYNGEGDNIGWQDYLASLSALPDMVNTSTDGGKLLHTSALVLKAQEDKTHAGALIASLSNPWGDTVSAEVGHTGYKAVWPRDFYQCAMALLALGDTETPLVSFQYLEKVQVTDKTAENNGDTGWFLQKTHVDGKIEWVGVQLDQTAMPIMLGWKLWQAGVLSDAEISHWYQTMLKPAADFLVTGGLAKIDWNDTQITSPVTQQERWEEQAGYSPSTTAAIVAGLVTASDIANHAGDTESAARFLATAKTYSSAIESQMFTTSGPHQAGTTDGNYYVRISPNGDPQSDEKLLDNNGRAGLSQKTIIDGGFLELVRYGVRAANDEHVLATLPVYDSQTLEENLKVKYIFEFEGVEGQFPGWRRYGNDGYGEDEVTGSSYAESGDKTPGQRGRVWPFFTGERGHYELAAATQQNGDKGLSQEEIDALRHTYVKGLEQFANKGMMLPEQVWDGVGDATRYNYKMGDGTNSATPLAWTHAEYVKLVRSMADQKVWDHYPIVSEKLAK